MNQTMTPLSNQLNEIAKRVDVCIGHLDKLIGSINRVGKDGPPPFLPVLYKSASNLREHLASLREMIGEDETVETRSGRNASR